MGRLRHEISKYHRNVECEKIAVQQFVRQQSFQSKQQSQVDSGIQRKPNLPIVRHTIDISFYCSGSVDLNESRSISIDYEKPSSLSSDDGMHASGPMPSPSRVMPHNSPTRPKLQTSNTLFVQPMNNLANLGQSLPNLNLNAASVNSNNTLSVPGAYTSGTALLSSTHRGISYPPPSPTRQRLFHIFIRYLCFFFARSQQKPATLLKHRYRAQRQITRLEMLWIKTV